MKALIFGASGQDGNYLHKLCMLKGIEPIGISRSGDWLHGNVANFGQVEKLVKDHRPAYLFHLAANSTTRHEALFENHETICSGTLNVLEAVKRHNPATKVFITGSGLQFKNTGEPISEYDEFEGNSPYSVARIQSVYAARYYRSIGIRAYVGYLFHHESPLRKQNHVCKMIAEAVRRISTGSDEVLELGDISVAKEWTFAGDVVKGILTLVEQDVFFEAVIGSGETHTIEQWLECCFSLVNKDWHDYVKLKEGFKAEYPILVSNPALIQKIGWHPETDLKKLAKIMICP